MSVVEPGAAGAGMVARAKALLTRPSATWDQIDVEPATVGGLFRGWVLPLAAIPAVAGAIGLMTFGISGGFMGFGFSWRPSPLWVVGNALLQYGLGVAMVFILGVVINGLAKTFGAVQDHTQAIKVAAYAPTASWVAGAVMIVPQLGILAFLGGLYSLYLLYVGLPKLMKAPPERAMPYFGAVVAVAILASIVAAIATNSIMGVDRMARMAGPGAMSGKVTVPGQGEVDLGRLEAQAERAQEAARRIQSGEGLAASDPDALKALLPGSVSGFTRTEVEASSGAAAGIEGSQAEATYERAGANLRLQVTDLGEAGALAGMASAFKVKSSKETATGYERVDTIDGRLTQESYDRAAKSGEYSVLVGQRFMVEARGDGVTIAELKAAVDAVGVARLEALAKAD
ncbi:Yip1 family protein [Phenylobacterium kunshanense]|nr:Yip1 family protein [Phenylobacterium kunshanense]